MAKKATLPKNILAKILASAEFDQAWIQIVQYHQIGLANALTRLEPESRAYYIRQVGGIIKKLEKASAPEVKEESK